MPESPLSVSLIGLGNMGLPMAARWVGAGVTVHGFDLSEEARDRLAALGGIPYPTAAAAAAASDHCVLMLPNSRIVDAVVSELLQEGALPVAATVLDMSSSQPANTVANAERFREAGVRFVDAPVSGGVRGVVAGTLAIMVGGSATDVADVEPLLSVLGSVVHVGPAGSGHAAKALNNMVAAAHLWATSEAVVIAESFGIAPATMIEVLNHATGRSVSSEVKWPRFILSETFDSGFHTSLLAKDTRIAGDMAEGLGMPGVLAQSVARLWQEATDALPPGSDHTEVAKHLAALRNGSVPIREGEDASL